MRTKWLALAGAVALVLSVPAVAAADPKHESSNGQEHRHDHGKKHPQEHAEPSLDWSAYPADIQSLKTQLDELRVEQKELFRQIHAQREQIKAAHHSMTPDQRKTLIKKSKGVIGQLRDSGESIREKREQKRQAWEKFRQHTEAKQWDAAKIDLQTIVERKRSIIQEQRNVLKLQQQIAILLPPSASVPKAK